MRFAHWLIRRQIALLFWMVTWGLAALIVVPPLARRRAAWLLEIIDPENETDDADD